MLKKRKLNRMYIHIYIYVIPKRSKIHHPNVSKVKEVGRNHGGIFSSFCHTCPICLELVLFREKWRKGHTCRCHHFHLLWERKGKGGGFAVVPPPPPYTLHTLSIFTGSFFHTCLFPWMGYGLRIRTLNTPIQGRPKSA